MTTIAQTLVGGNEPIGRLASVVGDVLAGLGPLRMAGVVVPTADVVAAIAALLDVPVGNLALTAWQQHRDVAAARASTAANPGTHEVVRLLEHRIESHQAPVIDVTVNGVSQEVLALDLDVEVEAASVDLVIRNGTVDEVRSGPAIARGKLSASGVELASHEFQVVDLGLSSRLGGATATVGETTARVGHQ